MPIYVVGVGPGSKEYIHPLAWETVLGAELLVGGQKALDIFPEVNCRREVITKNLPKTVDLIAQEYRRKQVVVLTSGDPGFFSILTVLRRVLGSEAIKVIPGVSTVQLAFARLALNWEDAVFVSLHGRPLESILPFLGSKKLCLLLDRDRNPVTLAQFLLQQGLVDCTLHIMTDLGTSQERVEPYTPAGALQWQGSSNCLVVMLNEGEK